MAAHITVQPAELQHVRGSRFGSLIFDQNKKGGQRLHSPIHPTKCIHHDPCLCSSIYFRVRDPPVAIRFDSVSLSDSFTLQILFLMSCERISSAVMKNNNLSCYITADIV